MSHGLKTPCGRTNAIANTLHASGPEAAMTLADRRDPAPDAQRKVTMVDVARACGVSRATVSLVLRGSPLVRADTRRRVEAEMRRQGYVYNRAAANLRQRISNTVALVIDDLSNPFFFRFVVDVNQALGSRGYVTLLGHSDESLMRQREVLQMLMEHQPAGIILAPVERSNAGDLALVIGRHTPLLVFNRKLAGKSTSRLACAFLEQEQQDVADAAVKRLLKLMTMVEP